MITKKRMLVFAVLMLVLVFAGTGCLRQLTSRMDTLADKLGTAYDEMAIMNDQMETTKKQVSALKQKLATSNSDMAAMNRSIDEMNKQLAEMDKSIKHMKNLDATLEGMQKKLATIGILFERILGQKQSSSAPLQMPDTVVANEQAYLEQPVFVADK